MTILQANVPIADVRGDALRLTICPTSLPAIASTTVEVGGFVVVLEVLAASHRVTVSGEVGWTETVACAVGEGRPVDEFTLPTQHVATSPRAAYRFDSESVTGAERVADIADQLRSSDAFVVQFPGLDDALTALDVSTDGAGLAWRSWHLYPGDQAHAVLTTSALHPATLLVSATDALPSTVKVPA